MFIDEAIIAIKAGDGGNGCFAYSRDSHKPKGPPAGGNGGRGGHIYVEGNYHLHTLQDVAYHKTYKASRGTHGKGSNQYGRNGEDTVIPIPLGTAVYDEETGRMLLDCLEDGQRVLVARGGRGGRGNAALANRNNPQPQQVEPGKPGEAKRMRLELKVLADIGLVGRPNAGKSTFLSRISHAHPKIADYPFTTTVPHLGIVKTQQGFGSYVVADIPGLIEGSHTGKGLGVRFLRHIERTKMLAILVECLSPDPQADANVLIEELTHYSPLLAEKPKVFILTKADLIDSAPVKKAPHDWMVMSAVTGHGVQEVLRRFEEMISAIGEDESPASE
jgi:GTP-binding protein